MNAALDVATPWVIFAIPVVFLLAACALAALAVFFLVRLIKKSKKAAPAPEKTAEDDTNESESK